MVRKLCALVSGILIGFLRSLGVPYRVVHRWLEGKGEMQKLSCNIAIDEMCGWFLWDLARMGMFLPGLFAAIDQVVRIVECALSGHPSPPPCEGEIESVLVRREG